MLDPLYERHVHEQPDIVMRFRVDRSFLDWCAENAVDVMAGSTLKPTWWLWASSAMVGIGMIASGVGSAMPIILLAVAGIGGMADGFHSMLRANYRRASALLADGRDVIDVELVLWRDRITSQTPLGPLELRWTEVRRLVDFGVAIAIGDVRGNVIYLPRGEVQPHVWDYLVDRAHENGLRFSRQPYH